MVSRGEERAIESGGKSDSRGVLSITVLGDPFEFYWFYEEVSNV